MPVSSEDRHYEEELSRRKRRERRRAGSKALGGLVEFVVILAISFVLVFGVVRPYIVEAFYIPSESMVPTLMVGDRVLVNKFIYRFTEPQRGDIVVFKSVEGGGEDLIKRVVGIPGDRIAVRDGRLYVNGEPRREPYVNRKFPDHSFFGPKRVPPEHVFVMGDNRANSRDSRYFGPVPYENLEGRAFLLFWPPDRIRLL